MIGVDWGTSSLRAYRMRGRTVLERREATTGIMQVTAGGFADALRAQVGDWLEGGETHVLMAGMVGSRQGWAEAPYQACPAGIDELAASLLPVPFDGATVAIVPGLRHRDAGGVPEVMRGEETQLVGAGADGMFCLPGTHSKWARVEGGGITGFSTAMTGEVFAAVRGHTILGRMMRDGPVAELPFRRGVARAREAGGLLHLLFGVRTLGLFGELAEDEAASYLSGLLIGSEIEAVAPEGVVRLIGEAGLCRLYGWALAERGARAEAVAPDAAATGLAMVAEQAGWV